MAVAVHVKEVQTVTALIPRFPKAVKTSFWYSRLQYRHNNII